MSHGCNRHRDASCDRSTETALLKLVSHVLINQQVGLLAVLHLSVAFDCVDHDILLPRLQSLFGLGVVLDWIHSFLTDRSQCVSSGGCILSLLISLCFGVPQAVPIMTYNVLVRR